MTRILWFTWKDKTNPLAGGAEVVASELGKRLVADGHELIFLVGGYSEVRSPKSRAKSVEKIDGYTVIRVGGRYSVYWAAYKYYKKNLAGWADVAIDEINTIPFFTPFYINNSTSLRQGELSFAQERGHLGGEAPSAIVIPAKAGIQDDNNSVCHPDSNNGGMEETKNSSTCHPERNTSVVEGFQNSQTNIMQQNIHKTKSINKPKHYLFVHQLCQEIWFYQIFFPLNIIGYIIEPIYLWLLRKNEVITISNSTKEDLMKYGFKKENIQIISEGVHIASLSTGEMQSLCCHPERSGNEVEGSQNHQKDTNQKTKGKITKYKKPTILSLGAVRKMKRTSHQLKAFEIAKKQIPELQLKISGLVNDKYGEKFIKDIANSPYRDDIEFMGRVNDVKKEELMQRSHLITVTSLKEGWGLIVTEANSQGTPAVVYNVDGLRDSVKDDETGIVCEENIPENLAKNIVKLLKDEEKYDKLRRNAWEWSREITFEKSYEDFKEVLNLK